MSYIVLGAIIICLIIFCVNLEEKIILKNKGLDQIKWMLEDNEHESYIHESIDYYRRV